MPRSRSLALSRKSKAVSLFREGKNFEQIAREVGFSNRGTAYRVVTRAFQDQIVEDIDLHREMEVARLDEIQVHLWDLVAEGDVRAADTLLRVMDQRCKLLGLYDRHESPRTLVMPTEGNTGKATPNLINLRHERQKAS